MAMEKETLLNLDNGDIVYRQYDTVVLEFAGKRNVLSSTLFNGGWRDDLQAVLNHHPAPDEEAKTIEGFWEQNVNLCLKLDYDPVRICALGTGVPMKNVVIKQAKYDKLKLCAIVTAGVEGNAGRVGDTASFPALTTNEKLPNGTINIIVYFDAKLPEGVQARALVTATEAKTAALQELMIGSRYSDGLATGTGTDQIVSISNPTASVAISDCGKHTKPGELLGKIVKEAVKEAIYKHNGYNGAIMHDVFRRMQRFGVTKDGLVTEYKSQYGDSVDVAVLYKAMDKLNNTGNAVAVASLCAHLTDQVNWGLLSADEARAEADDRLMRLVMDQGVDLSAKKNIIDKWKLAYMALLHREVKQCSKK